jgi:dihydroflavonol-4-reductase
MFTGKSPLLTKETATTAQAKVYFDNSKLLQHLPGFIYTPLPLAIKNICAALQEKYNLR